MRFTLSISILVLFFLSACQSAGTEATPSLAAQIPTDTLPASSPTPPPQLLYLLDPQSAASQSDHIQAALSLYADAHSLDFLELDSIESISANTPLIALIAMGDFPQLADFASANPQAKIIVLAESSQGDAPNVFFLSENQKQAEIAAFLLGYAAALSTDDWRVGVLYAQDELLHANAFVAGAEYFCGACGPVAPPYNNYPQSASVADAANWLPQAQELINQGVRTIYLSPALERPEIQQYFAERSISLLGTTAPDAGIASQWLLTISPLAQSQITDQIIAVLEGQFVESSPDSVTFSNVNASVLSEARILLLQETLVQIEVGLIAMPSDIAP